MYVDQVSGECKFVSSEWPVCATIAPAPVPSIVRVVLAATGSATSAGTPTLIPTYAFLPAYVAAALGPNSGICTYMHYFPLTV
jgi:hypothetical protein